ncbi:hypothetical protein V502_05543 [Pseudogymnoascus sp. VKM F-4520 (FW-2644)]|nr:hypothetical protein V502_05543 [Pseudogymnoascus sp. VKM F-4520 (FW-2644)]
MEYLNYTYDSEGFSLADLDLLSNVRSPDECFMTRPDQSSASTINFSAFPMNGGTSSSNSSAASEAGFSQSPVNGDISQYGDQNWDDLRIPRRRGGTLKGADGTTRHTLRRRTQNRTAQRKYRQRREDARKILEDKLNLAENEYRDLGKMCTELHVSVEMLRDQLKKLEAENTALWASIYSMPWRKNSE